ncbi:MAG: SAM-dependent DNA methyltransferase [Gammaproteobacteria bacterium]|nr:SAM-dependent DNA methyltransferase [Gammaproteobacteria bacterium]
MAIRKSELYSSLWASCDELRGGMDASQYKDYVLGMLFVKYVSDKYAGLPFAPIDIPAGASFRDLVALKGKPTIGDDINKKIIGPLASANRLADMPDFYDAAKLGSGKEMVDRLTNLVAIFENKALDFSKNRADGDDILGDAYEYLMRHFATESGKSKGQFYTPAEVSRIMARIVGIGGAGTSNRGREARRARREQGGEEGAFAALEKLNAAAVKDRLKEIAKDTEAADERAALERWLALSDEEAALKKQLKAAEAALDAAACAQYPKLDEAEIKSLIVDAKWLAALDTALHGELDRVSQGLARRVKELAERYETPLPRLNDRMAELEAKVSGHLERLGFVWR